MLKKAVLVPLLVLGWVWTLQGVPVQSESLYTTQENFNLSQILGTWYDVASASTSSHPQNHSTADLVTGKLVLERDATESNLKVIRTVLRHGACKETSGEYELTSTPGRFSYRSTKSSADLYVVHTNYIEYAIVINFKEKSPGQNSTSVKLYSRKLTVRPTVMEDFKTLVREQGMSNDSVVIKQSKADCVLEQQQPTTQPEPQRVRRNAVPTPAPADMEGSGMEDPLFDGKVACRAAPDTGPCFGLQSRYFYNSSSMTCELFKYGGCLGNQNNFENERECLQRCRTEAVCRLPMVAQPCTGGPPIWAFDSSVGLCVAYKQGFCQANGNKFYSKAECEEYCGVDKDDEELLKTSSR